MMLALPVRRRAGHALARPAHAAARRRPGRPVTVGLLVAVTAAGLLASLGTGSRAGHATDCMATSSPTSGVGATTVYNSHGVQIRRFIPRGYSPIFVATANSRYSRAVPLFNAGVPQRRQVRDMMGTTLAAVNGDFFSSAGAVGTEVNGGSRPIKGTEELRPSLVFQPAGLPQVGSVRLDISLHAQRSTGVITVVGAHAYNSPQDWANSIAVFDSHWGSTATMSYLRWPAQPAVSYLVANGHVALVTPGANQHPIPAGGFLVVAQGGGNDRLIAAGWRQGAAVALHLQAHTSTGAQPYASIGVGEVVMQHGLVPGNACGYDAATPRTAVGISGGNLLMVAASGRGLTMRELNGLLHGLGISDAVLLDGGGSTVMTERTSRPVQLTVHPYTYEGDRPVPNGIGVVVR